ncbi:MULTISPECIES: cysteine desulfurase/sulfurtransferase TusA family protein [unclassified Streptomyces]|uniref:cysteine desulfurase/sulfurtransferase TusA family protein n=1 Tax=unclassified Streptomyces TaxID=2593676 RepID=UPI002E2EE6DC|nr:MULTISPECIES: aminotransferase class V-fold PLP-dependent enzyme [unclassified Streptomyces]WUC66766.1 cysteine desulfurase/sulfurtransferase TusA family protein [Streptomyces sp. NBC_00539]
MPYFDSASAAPLHPVARQALLAALDEGWADPVRLYREGRRARLLLDAAREAAAEAVGCRADELVFTPSGTHAVHTGVAGALAGRRRVGGRLVVSAVEHSCVLHAAEAHAASGGTVTEVAVDRLGAVSPDAYAAALDPATALACLQSANHEVGTVQPVAEVAELCGAAGVPLLVDAAQSLGWGPVEGAWSLLTASAHKWGGPPGVGLLVVRKGVRFAPQHPADERESGRSPGFANLPAIVAAAASLRAVRAEADAEAARLRVLVDRIRRRVARLVPDVEVVGDAERRLPHLVTFSCLYADGETLLHELDRAGYSVSSGSSCTSSTLTASHVLKAMGVLSEGNVRVSLPAGTTADEVNGFLEVLPKAVAGIRARLGVPQVQETVPVAESVELDALGLRCPQPVIELARAIGTVPVGGTVTVVSDDEVARLDIPAWCSMRGHAYLGETPRPVGAAYAVRRLR